MSVNLPIMIGSTGAYSFIKRIIAKLLGNTFEFDLDRFGKQSFSMKVIPIYKNAILAINDRIIHEVKNYSSFFTPRIFVLSDGTTLEIALNIVNQRLNLMVLWNGNPLPINVNAKYKFKMVCGGVGIYGFLLSLFGILNFSSHELDEFGIGPHSIFFGLIYLGFSFALYMTRSIKLLFLCMTIFSSEVIASQFFAPHYSSIGFQIFSVCVKLILLVPLYANFIENINVLKNQKELRDSNLNPRVFFGADSTPLHGEWVNDDQDHYMFSTVGNFIFCGKECDGKASVSSYEVRDEMIVLFDEGGHELLKWSFELKGDVLEIFQDGKKETLRKIANSEPRVLALLTKDKSDECFIYPSVLIDPQAN